MEIVLLRLDRIGDFVLGIPAYRALRQAYPNIPQVACFDTAFFHDLPRVAQILSLPRKYESAGLRRYGFHGLSYSYLQSAFTSLAGTGAVNGRVIYAHLGSGASLAATLNGKPVDTTMSLTPASGIMMSSRSGDLDPGVFGFLERRGVNTDQFTHMVNHESGLLGVSELSADMQTLLEHETDNVKAKEAVSLFVYQIKKSIAALSATIGGLDSLIFAGGIGEQSPIIRSRVCQGLDYLGIEIDETKNQGNSQLISSNNSRVGVHVIPTDEAQIICQQVLHCIKANPESETQ